MKRVDPRTRPVSRTADGRLQYEVRGGDPTRFVDTYHAMLRASWTEVLGVFFAIYVTLNLVFGAMYWLVGGVAGVTPGRFDEAVWFSVQTLSTIGYGAMAPTQGLAHGVVFVESFVGIVYAAVATGLFFARFARPTARVVFSNVALVNTRDGVPSLVLRVANRRQNQLVDARVTVNVMVDEVTDEGAHLRRLHKLSLLRDETPSFQLSWTIIHPITEDSPLYGITADNVHERIGVVVVVLSGTDDTFAQQVHARRWYTPDELRFGAMFVDMMQFGGDRGLVMEIDRIHDVWWPEGEAPNP